MTTGRINQGASFSGRRASTNPIGRRRSLCALRPLSSRFALSPFQRSRFESPASHSTAGRRTFPSFLPSLSLSPLSLSSSSSKNSYYTNNHIPFLFSLLFLRSPRPFQPIRSDTTPHYSATTAPCCVLFSSPLFHYSQLNSDSRSETRESMLGKRPILLVLPHPSGREWVDQRYALATFPKEGRPIRS